ncbi:MAG: hypothetical protein CVT89_03280 [Candidatus Altiarchaeales archaeon HGW-Altiarchaeales-2]|nr:MAG: hypothetical protein CVT89_03280 [Candidatus Altiarchaeales archaeon HGW-Altiarchaeales-2]
MKNKTKNRLERKWQNLPLHHIDACVVIEVLIQQKECEDCKNYLNKVGYKCRSALSVSALGEIVMCSIKKFEEETEGGKVSLFITDLVNKRKIDFSAPQFETYAIVEKIKKIESRVELMDALNLATAITENADVFVTMDSKLVGNKKLESAFKIKIKHPRDV